MKQLQSFRDEIDNFMGNHLHSPLSGEQKLHFDGLSYFPHEPQLLFELPLHLLPEDTPFIEMETSTGEKRPYRRWAEIKVTLNEQACQLTIYSDQSGAELFLPFRDETNGKESYGAGRYLDNHRPGLELLNSSTIQVDFNFCYNPYCAYNDRYSCPLPPRENWLQVPVEAGEKKFPTS